MLSQRTFSTPDELVEILHMACQAKDGAEAVAKKRRKLQKVRASASRLDETAEWKPWATVPGLKLLGLRRLLEVFLGGGVLETQWPNNCVSLLFRCVCSDAWSAKEWLAMYASA